MDENNLFSEKDLYTILDEVKEQETMDIRTIMFLYTEDLLKSCNDFLIKANLYNANAKKYVIKSLDTLADELLNNYTDNKKLVNRSALLRSAYEIINLFGEIFRQKEIEYRLLMYDVNNITEVKEVTIDLKTFLTYTRGAGGFKLRTNQKRIDKNLKEDADSWDKEKVNRFIAFRSHIQQVSAQTSMSHTRLNVQKWGNLNNGKYLEGFLHYEEESLTSRCLGMYYGMNTTKSWRGPDLTVAERYFQLKGQSADVFSSIETTVKDIQMIKVVLGSLQNIKKENLQQIPQLKHDKEITDFVNKNAGEELKELFKDLEKEFNLTK